jgi:hypothetical protein
MITDKRPFNTWWLIMAVSSILLLIGIIAYFYYLFRDPTMPVGLVKIPIWVNVIILIGAVMIIIDMFIPPKQRL